MDTPNTLRDNLAHLVEDLREALHEIGGDAGAQTQVVNDTRDRLRYIASLTEQAASQTLNVAENLGETLRAQQTDAQVLLGKTRSEAVRAFLRQLSVDHDQSRQALNEVIQAQAFQDLVGQVINKLLVTVEKMETSLAHLLIENAPDPGLLAGPQIHADRGVSQEDIDSLFG